MPTYDYKCGACGHQFEHFQSMKDSPLRKCPKCAKSRLERLIGTGAAIIFKGSGFYQTDYRSEGYKKAAEADKPASDTKPETKPETKAESKAESKPEATPAPKSESRPASGDGKPGSKAGGSKSAAEGGTSKPRKAGAKG